MKLSVEAAPTLINLLRKQKQSIRQKEKRTFETIIGRQTKKEQNEPFQYRY